MITAAGASNAPRQTNVAGTPDEGADHAAVAMGSVLDVRPAGVGGGEIRPSTIGFLSFCHRCAPLIRLSIACFSMPGRQYGFFSGKLDPGRTDC